MNSSSDTPDNNSLQQEPASEVIEESVVKIPNDFLVEFTKKLSELETPEEKIAFGLSYMRDALSQEGSPCFREFWESRRLVLPLFKENVNSMVRSKLWGEYIELTQEARRLKEILEEQSAFAIEQIDLAIGAIEKDLAQFEVLLNQVAPVKFAETPYSLRPKIASYEKTQQELNLLNTFAGQLNGLRKEIVKTEMRIRFKTKFFKRLSQIGDQVFPRRKGQIEQVSSSFEKDVDLFIQKHFKGEEVVGAPYYALREEIKAFQSMAKLVTLSSSAFSRTRLCMSECWDKIKVLDKEHKKVLLEKKQASSEAFEAIRAKVEDLKTRSAEMEIKDIDKEIEAISVEMRAIYLDREDIRLLRESLTDIRLPHIQAQEKKMKELEESEKERFRLKREKISEVKDRIYTLSQKGDGIDLETIEGQFSSVEQEIGSLGLSKAEKKQMENLLRPLRDLITDKKELSLLNLSGDDLIMRENYLTVLKQKKERRAMIKDQIDVYRKALGVSGLDFEKSLHLSELLDQERERFDKATDGIEELERKINELES